MDSDSRDGLQAQMTVVLTLAVLFLVTILYAAYTYSNKGKDKTSKKTQPTEDREEDYEELLRNYQNEKGRGLSGSTKYYDWKQSETEMEVFVKLPEGRTVQARDVNVEIKSNSLRVALRGVDEPLVDGQLYAPVLWDESCWQLDTTDLGERVVWVTLFKSTPTVAEEHWKGVLKSDAAVKGIGGSLGEAGVAVHGVDPNDRSSMKKAVQKVKSS